MKLFLFAAHVIFALSIYSQEGDKNISGKVIYELNKDLGLPVSNDWKLEFNNNESLFTVSSPIEYTSTADKFIKKGENIKLSEKLVGHLYINLVRDSVYSQGLVYKTPYYIKDKIHYNTWKLSSETKEIAGFQCQKAKGNFRGRYYEVWFTPDIPVSLGPWKLLGLPGLILYAKDQTGSVEFIAKSIVLNDKISPVTKAYKELPHIGEIKTLQEYIKLKDLEYLEIHKAALARAPRKENTTTEVIPAGRLYKMEISYEWEQED